MRAVSGPSLRPTATSGANKGVTSGSVVVGATLVVVVVVEVVVGGIVVLVEVVDAGIVVVTGSVVLAEILVAPWAEPDEHAVVNSSRANDPATTLI
jgi:hypothetical protein